MPKLRHGSLFSGIGGFDLAAEWMGWENVFHCEWNDFGKKILKYYWPNAISYDDITKTDFTIHRGRIEILTGGFPCQPFSAAGVRRGKDDERYLWPEMLRAIREIQPRWIVGENVYGLVNWSGGLVFHEVQTDLEAQGYEIQPFLLPAAAVNAPHRRDRIWFVAYAGDIRRNAGGAKQSLSRHCTDGTKTNASDSNDNGQHGSDCQHEINASQGGEYALDDIEQMGRVAAYANGIGRNNGSDNRGERQVSHDEERSSKESEPERSGRVGGTGEICGDGDAADANGIGRRENERERNGKSNVIDKNGATTNWQNFPTVSPICNGDDGLSDRLDGITFSKWRQESIKGGGNAVVVPLVYQIFKTIDEYDRSTDPAAPDH